MSDLLQELRRANQLRNKEWDPQGVLDAQFFSNELAGEVGEALEKATFLMLLGAITGRACNIVKKIVRNTLGLPGSKATVEDLAEELADVVIVTDLLANEFNIDLNAAIVKKFNKTSDKVGLTVKL